MPHPPPCIWVCPCNWSLQPLYLSTLYYNHCTFTNIQIYRSEDRVALMPCQLRVPPPPTPTHAPQPQSPLVTPAPTGLTYQGAATNCGVRVQLRVIKGETFLLVHDRPPLPRSSSSMWFSLLFCFTLLEHCAARWQFGAHFSPFLCFPMFILLLLILLLLILLLLILLFLLL